MSFSRSRIAISGIDGIRSIVCEKDGTIEKVGKLLQVHYGHYKLLELMEHGDVLRLGIDFDDANHQLHPVKSNEFPLETTFFCRDLKTLNSRYKISAKYKDFIRTCEKDYVKNYFMYWRDSWLYGTLDHKSPFYKRLTPLATLIKLN